MRLFATALLFVGLWFSQASAQGLPQSGGITTVCQFTQGPRQGSTFDFAQFGVQGIPVGSPCQDGQGSTGVAIASGGGNFRGNNRGGFTTVCRFTQGPRQGTTFDFAQFGVQPIPVGSPCQDGQGSTGTAGQ